MNIAILVAAGSSRRMGADKLFAPLAGRPVLRQSIRAFEQCGEVDGILIVTRPERMAEVREYCKEFAKVMQVIEGGVERQDSVWNGLEALPDGTDAVAIHDAARPLIDPEMIGECFRAVKSDRAVACAAPVVDTLKSVGDDGCISGALDRTGVWALQTPQVFEAALLREALRAVRESGRVVTDDTSAVQEAGVPVRLLHNQRMNFKITFPADLALAECVLAARVAGGTLL